MYPQGSHHQQVLVAPTQPELGQKEGSHPHQDVGEGAGDEEAGHGDEHPGQSHFLTLHLAARPLVPSPRSRALQFDGRHGGGDGGDEDEETG